MQPAVPGQGKGQAGDLKPTQWAQAGLEGVKGEPQGGATARTWRTLPRDWRRLTSSTATRVGLKGLGQETSS